MKRYTKNKDFYDVLEDNGFYYVRSSGSHNIFMNSKGKHISIPNKISWVIARRLIKENNLKC